jgi:hypothetical protein
MNEYKPLKLDTPAVPAQGTAFVTKDQGGNKKGKGKTKYLKDTEWNVLSPEAQSKIIGACKKGKDYGKEKKSVASTKTIRSLSKTMRSLEKDNQRLKKSVSALQKCNEDEESSLSSEEDSSSEDSTSHFQDAMEMLEEYHPKVVLALKSSKSTNLDLRNVLYWTTNQPLICAATRRLHPR